MFGRGPRVVRYRRSYDTRRIMRDPRDNPLTFCFVFAVRALLDLFFSSSQPSIVPTINNACGYPGLVVCYLYSPRKQEKLTTQGESLRR